MLAAVNAGSQFVSGRRRRPAGGRVDDGRRATRVHAGVNLADDDHVPTDRKRPPLVAPDNVT